jgi:hypothetical protein
MALFIAAMTSRSQAGTAILPVVERPKITASQAIEIAQKQLGSNAGRYVIVGLDWAKRYATILTIQTAITGLSRTCSRTKRERESY